MIMINSNIRRNERGKRYGASSARPYRNLGDSFQLDRDRMDWLQVNDYCNTVDQVLEYVNEARADE